MALIDEFEGSTLQGCDREPHLVDAGGTWEDAWREFLSWADAKVPGRAYQQAAKFVEEAGEFLSAPSLDEAIDCMAVLMCWADRAGHNPDQVLARLRERIAVWNTRVYVERPDGTYHHIPEEAG